MNLFILDKNPIIAAQYNVDRHVVKIILESVEMLGYCFLNQNINFEPWPKLNIKRRYFSHPMSIAVRMGRENFDWCLNYSLALCDEYRFRYNKIHKTLHVLNWIKNHYSRLTFEQQAVDWPRCFGDYKNLIQVTNNIVLDYQNYYLLAKKHLFRWTKRQTPKFVN